MITKKNCPSKFISTNILQMYTQKSTAINFISFCHLFERWLVNTFLPLELHKTHVRLTTEYEFATIIYISASLHLHLSID